VPAWHPGEVPGARAPAAGPGLGRWRARPGGWARRAGLVGLGSSARRPARASWHGSSGSAAAWPGVERGEAPAAWARAAAGVGGSARTKFSKIFLWSRLGCRLG